MQDLITEVELLLSKMVGRIVAESIVRNQLAKLGKNRDALSAADWFVMIPNVVNSLALFADKKQADLAQSELNRLVNARLC